MQLHVVDDLVGQVPAVQEVLLKVLLRGEWLHVGLKEVHLFHGHKRDIAHGPDNVTSWIDDVTVLVLAIKGSIGGGTCTRINNALSRNALPPR